MIRRAAKRCLYKEDEAIPQKGRKKKVHSFVFLAVFSIRAVKRCKEKLKIMHLCLAGGDPVPDGCGEDPGRAVHPPDGNHLQNSHR